MDSNRKGGDKLKWIKSENQRVIDEINLYKKKQSELERKINELSGSLKNRCNQLDIVKKRCEETKLQLTEMATTEKRIAGIHELEKSRYSKLQQAVEQHKAAILRITKQNKDKLRIHAVSPGVLSPNQVSYAHCSREYQLDEKERLLGDLKRSLVKREQEVVIKKNHNAARVIRLRKLLQSNEGKRALCKEQLAALKSKTNRRY